MTQYMPYIGQIAVLVRNTTDLSEIDGFITDTATQNNYIII